MASLISLLVSLVSLVSLSLSLSFLHFFFFLSSIFSSHRPLCRFHPVFCRLPPLSWPIPLSRVWVDRFASNGSFTGLRALFCFFIPTCITALLPLHKIIGALGFPLSLTGTSFHAFSPCLSSFFSCPFFLSFGPPPSCLSCPSFMCLLAFLFYLPI